MLGTRLVLPWRKPRKKAFSANSRHNSKTFRMAPCKAWELTSPHPSAALQPKELSSSSVSCNFPQSPYEAYPRFAIPCSERAPSALPRPRIISFRLFQLSTFGKESPPPPRSESLDFLEERDSEEINCSLVDHRPKTILIAVVSKDYQSLHAQEHFEGRFGELLGKPKELQLGPVEQSQYEPSLFYQQTRDT